MVVRACLTIAILACSLADAAYAQRLFQGRLPPVAVRVIVTDFEGKPVAKAKITTNRTWKESYTDDEGIVDLLPWLRQPTERVKELECSVEHPDHPIHHPTLYGAEKQHIRIQLKRGYRIEATAVRAETGQPIKADLFALSAVRDHPAPQGPSGKDWTLDASTGVLTSKPLAHGETAVRFVHIPERGPRLFSEVVLIQPGDEPLVRHRVELNRGTVVTGTLDESVPRPVMNGSVWVSVFLPDDGPQERRARCWSDRTVVNPDGTFRLDSVPSNELAQVFAVCDGWVSASPDAESLKHVYPELADQLTQKSPVSRTMPQWPQLVGVNGRELFTTIRMERCARLRARVTTPDGEPLPGVVVTTHPLQTFFDGRFARFAAAVDDGEKLRQGRQRFLWGGFYFPEPRLYAVQTGADGTAIINNLPARQQETYYKWKRQRPMLAIIDPEPGETVDVNITLQPE